MDYFRMGKYDKAVEALKKAVDIAGMIRPS